MTNGQREPELEKVDTSAHAQKFALHSLSSQEKLLLIELQKTRAQIVNELNKIDPAACGSDDNWFSVKDTILHRKSIMLQLLDWGFHFLYSYHSHILLGATYRTVEQYMFYKYSKHMRLK